MNKEELNERIADLASQKNQVLAKQEEGKNVVISGQQIIEQTNQMIYAINGAEQDCQFWLMKFDEAEKKLAADKEQADKEAAAALTKVAAFEEADAYKAEEETSEL